MMDGSAVLRSVRLARPDNRREESRGAGYIAASRRAAVDAIEAGARQDVLPIDLRHASSGDAPAA